MSKKQAVHQAPVYVGESKIHGKGLFAARDIKKGELLGEFKCQPTKKDGAHVIWMAEDRAYKVLDDFKYINHDDRANAAYYDDFTVMAIKKIKKDDEITHYYGQDW
ncbi:SET domain-containing protein-lysine N-methyltransferase [sulfur-oxidizing endosymbiont of Gigantopelta aegis]|uniref:SET domain-containing protein-lysine N-methyltransferase n=1 Tax=sulfur-oxidizing endosymbiont of Gigantopelta aegis TaxID=2794934 RepID=UPI0018DC32FB|nr:SET domain-containing protein-lysine N-methyltransferase [sulfur-oxidizing endosymbiont of Gigantopelta aegis]